MKNKNWFWGFFFLISAIFVLASQLGSFSELGVLSVLASVLIVTVIIHSLIKLNFFGVFIPAAFLYMIYIQPFDLPIISPWMLIVSGLLASIGFSIIFHKHHHKHLKCHHEFEHTTVEMDDNNPYVKVHFGASSRYIHADCLRSGHFISSFGALEVYFDQTQLSPEGAEILLDCNFGAITLYVPKHWVVIDKLHTSIGGVDNHLKYSKPTENSPRLTLNGTIQMGGVEIKYI